MRIAVIKPDHRMVGGFELVVDKVIAGLGDRGHRVALLAVDLGGDDRRLFGLEVDSDEWNRAGPYFSYLRTLERCAAVDVSGYDLVISTQPGSFAVRHPHHLALFFHHHRAYYDLSELYVEAGFVTDAELHRRCQDAVRRIDEACFDGVTVVLAGSEEVADRVREYNGIDDVMVFHAGLGVDGVSVADPVPPGDLVLSVSRHEFPKRTELFAAAAVRGGRSAVAVGDGGRLPWVRHLAAEWVDDGVPEELDRLSTWSTEVPEGFRVPAEPGTEGPVRFAGRVPDAELDGLYRRARCVVAPAYREDYGLTAIEAMARGRPVVVCKDGGGLADLVDHGRTGFVVDPTPAAIDEAVTRLFVDDGLAEDMGAAARDAASAFTWDRALDELEAGIARVFG